MCSEEGNHRKTRGARVAQLVECTSHVQRLGPRCSSPDFESDLWPFAPCRKWLTWKRQHQSRRSRTDHRKEMPADPLGNGALCASCLSMLMSSAAPPLALKSWEYILPIFKFKTARKMRLAASCPQAPPAAKHFFNFFFFHFNFY